jgi:hypothetical protein
MSFLITIAIVCAGLFLFTLALPAILTTYVVGKWDWEAIKKVYIMVCFDHKDEK